MAIPENTYPTLRSATIWRGHRPASDQHRPDPYDSQDSNQAELVEAVEKERPSTSPLKARDSHEPCTYSRPGYLWQTSLWHTRV